MDTRPPAIFDKVPNWIEALRDTHPQTPADFFKTCQTIAQQHGYQIVSRFDASEIVFFRGNYFVGPGVYLQRRGCLAIGTAQAFATEEVVRRHHAPVVWAR